MQTYLDLLQDVMDNGEYLQNRTGVATKSVFGRQLRFDLSEGFPAVTTKKLAFHAVKSELLWMLSGSSCVDDLRAIQYGEDNRYNPDKRTVWDDNYEVQGRALGYTDGQLGPVYGAQWRGRANHFTDQISAAIEQIKSGSNSRRIIVSSWDVASIDRMALPPCHLMFQFKVVRNKLCCLVYLRSNDLFLGAPFNIASYALLTHMVAQVCELEVGELVYTIGDAHIYENHFEVVEKQLNRTPLNKPKLMLNGVVDCIDDFVVEDINLVHYDSYGVLSASMVV
jgi:thymidylate synthase